MIHLVIQGPMLSKGRTYSGKYVDHHSFDDVLKNILGFKEISSGQIVLSTYTNELTDSELQIINDLNVIVNFSTNINPKNYVFGIGKHKSHDDNSKNQYNSFIEGFRSLKDINSEDYVLKIRTDILLDFISINESNSLKKKLYIQPWNHFKNIKFIINPHVDDFLILGRANSMERIFYNMLNKPYSSFVHLNLAAAITAEIANIRINYISLEKMSSKEHTSFYIVFLPIYLIVKLFNSFIIHIIKYKVGLLNAEFTDNIIWRGSKKI